MKTLLKTTAVLLLGFALTAHSQGREHEGFYLSMQAGPAMGYINGNWAETESMKISGTGIGFDILLGGVIKENLILHGVLGIKSIYGPEIKYDGLSTTLNKDYSFDEIIIGAGTTYYFHNNFFVTGNIGLGNFSLSNESDNSTIDTGEGFSFQLKAGKEWWISPRWAMGVVLEYGGTRVEDTVEGERETWQSHRYSLRLTATLNGKK